MIYYTTLEQSKKLVELGLDRGTADMHHIEDATGYDTSFVYSYSDAFYYKKRYWPCWTVGAMIALMPNRINAEPNLLGLLCVDSNSCGYYEVREGYRGIPAIVKFRGKLHNCVFELMCWLLEKGIVVTCSENPNN